MRLGWLAAMAALAGPGLAAGSPPLECIERVDGAMYNSVADTRQPLFGAETEWEWLSVFYRLQLPCRAGGSGDTVVPAEGIRFTGRAPLLADLDGDGEDEVVTVEIRDGDGARMAVYARRGVHVERIAGTPWLGAQGLIALVAVGDLDGDGVPEIAEVARPHEGGRLRLWQLRDGELVALAEAGGLTNLREGAAAVQGGLRDCGRPELVLAPADWSALMAVGWDGAALSPRQIGTDTSPEAFAAALACAVP